MDNIEKVTALYNKAIAKDLLEIDIQKNKFIKDILRSDFNNTKPEEVDKKTWFKKLVDKLKVIWSV